MALEVIMILSHVCLIDRSPDHSIPDRSKIKYQMMVRRSDLGHSWTGSGIPHLINFSFKNRLDGFLNKVEAMKNAAQLKKQITELQKQNSDLVTKLNEQIVLVNQVQAKTPSPSHSKSPSMSSLSQTSDQSAAEQVQHAPSSDRGVTEVKIENRSIISTFLSLFLRLMIQFLKNSQHN